MQWGKSFTAKSISTYTYKFVLCYILLYNLQMLKWSSKKLIEVTLLCGSFYDCSNGNERFLSRRLNLIGR